MDRCDHEDECHMLSRGEASQSANASAGSVEPGGERERHRQQQEYFAAIARHLTESDLHKLSHEEASQLAKCQVECWEETFQERQENCASRKRKAEEEKEEPWWMKLNRMPFIVDACKKFPQIVWEMQAEDEVSPFHHCVEVLNRHVGKWRKFKIGHTHVPDKRWTRFTDMERFPVQLLVFAFVGENVDQSSDLEEELVDEFWGDPRLLNIRRAGDTDYTHFGFSPFFVYIAFQ